MDQGAVFFQFKDDLTPTITPEIEPRKFNCWEFKRCGREPGGAGTRELGVCPTATFEPADGYCGGKNGGRACAYIAGTFCSKTIPGTQRDLSKNCSACEFYKGLRAEEGADLFSLTFERYVRAKAGLPPKPLWSQTLEGAF